MDTLMKPLARPLQQIQHDKPLWKEQEEFRGNEVPEHYWLPTKEERGVPYEAETKPPSNPANPPRFPSYPSPSKLVAADETKRAELLAKIEERKAKRAAQLAARNVRNDRHDKGGSYDSRMAVYGPPPPADDTEASAKFDDSSTLDLDSFAAQREARQKRLETDKRREEGKNKRRDRRAKKHREPVSRIPWTLLDELAHEKYKLKAEMAMTLLFDDKKKKEKQGATPNSRTKEGEIQRYAENGF